MQQRHIYPPIISKELFDRCQEVCLGRSHRSFKWGSKDYIFRGLIRCATTGRVVSSDTKTRSYPNGKIAKWTYLLPWDTKNPKKKIHVRENKILDEVQNIFNQMHLAPEVLKKAIESIRASKVCRAGAL